MPLMRHRFVVLARWTCRISFLPMCATMWGLGAACSNILAGWIFVVAGYHAAFISLGSIAAAGLVLYATAMPETGPGAT
jgi:hypothetical protein